LIFVKKEKNGKNRDAFSISLPFLMPNEILRFAQDDIEWLGAEKSGNRYCVSLFYLMNAERRSPA